MSGKSSIEWTDASWNPVRGCVKISPGCKHCYAETFAERWRGIEGHAYEHGFDPRLVPEALDWPLRRRKPLTIFVNSMSDLYQDAVPFEFVAAVYGVMAAARRHTFQVLTKRADRRPGWHAWLREYTARRNDIIGGPRETISVKHFADILLGRDCADLGLDVRANEADPLCFDARPWPLPNVWEGVSVEDRKYGVPRIEHLRNTPAAVRFLSIEPLLEDLGKLDLAGIHQVIVGAESGHGARPMHDDWVRSIRDQCIAQNVRFFFKQRATPSGKKISLPVLDGRQWAEMPEQGRA